MRSCKFPTSSLLIVVSFAGVLLLASPPPSSSCDKTRKVFTDTWGVITDGSQDSNYTQDSHCEWLIKASNSSQFISLVFKSMGTECSYDYVFVYDGDSYKSPLLGSFSGQTKPQIVTASSGYMLILLYSDTNYVLDGFRAEFSVANCPNNCSNHGNCYAHQCICDDDWGGTDCSFQLCPDLCHEDEGYGGCESGKCICSAGYSGRTCSLNVNDTEGNKWHWLSRTHCGLTPRAAHTAIYHELTDALYVYGGYDLNQVLGALEIYHFKNNSWTDENDEILEDQSLLLKVNPTSIREFLFSGGSAAERHWGLPQKSSFIRTALFAGINHTFIGARKQRDSATQEKPSPRYGHAACAIGEGFVIYGGKLHNGSLSNELWSYNIEQKKWSLRAVFSDVKPPAVTRHTLTAVNDKTIYLFGGSLSDGEFSSELFKIKLSGSEQWVRVMPRGGKELDVRVVAHSTVYYPATNSLIVYGGVVAGVARFSKLSDRIYAFQINSRHWTEIHYTREHLREKFVPQERAFHTANVIGNYLVVFGGYSHRHNKEEICYDNQMYLYHLGCHAWVNPDILGNMSLPDSRYPKEQGVFAHASAVRNDNTLLLVGGYHGNVNGDLLAFTVPPMIAPARGRPYDPEAACSRHHSFAECSADPECGWCSADTQCYGRTLGINCTTNLQTTRCPGICPALGDCHSCLLHGRTPVNFLPTAASKLGLGDCSWCVQNARCHHKDDNYGGVCGGRDDTPTQVTGWWGAKGTEVLDALKCRELDRRPGLTFLRYYNPPNWTQPDYVTIINATTVDFTGPNFLPGGRNKESRGETVAQLRGFLRISPEDWDFSKEMLQACPSNCRAYLELSVDTEVILSANLSESVQCHSEPWPEMFPNRVRILYEAHRPSNKDYHDHSKMVLNHHQLERDRSSQPSGKMFTFEYLEPYANGECSQYHNCLYCLTDSKCGWCDSTEACLSRDSDETVLCPADPDWHYLTLQPASCANCSNYISCETCTNSGLCEWLVEDARCVRTGRSPSTSDVVFDSQQCPSPCYTRRDCSSCLDTRGRCVWCEATHQCFSFSVYTSEYQFGLCREWLDQAPQLTTNSDLSTTPPPRRTDQCKSCNHYNECSSCLSTLGCGWCYIPENPIHGACVAGDFNHPHMSCSAVLNVSSQSILWPPRWAYAHCPDVDECGLGIHDCHKEAVCTNTDGSFSCHCRRGFIGDGKTTCERTCYNVCVHGKCTNSPDYKCACDLGWTGDDCSIDCGCNNHSTCVTGVGICDQCQNWTGGDRCEHCLPGSFGNVTASGCKPCECNGHGNQDLGVCNMTTGICHCQDDTEGEHCDKCSTGYYGNPRNGGRCYRQCEARGVLTEYRSQGIGSRQSGRASWGGPPAKECLWIISPDNDDSNDVPVTIQFRINSSNINVTCGENAIYVYDGMPELRVSGQQSALAAVLCTEDADRQTVIESHSGHLTVHYKQGHTGEGFDALYTVLGCDDHCDPPRVCNKGKCECKEGTAGPDCTDSICANNCSYSIGHGTCDRGYGRCLCNSGWAGKDCSHQVLESSIVFAELFDTHHLADSFEHLRKTLPRFGHTLSADRRGSLWMFGGYSLSHGPLNDLRLFDTRNNTWMQVTVDSTPDAKMPLGRYFHAADMVHTRQTIYIYGGLTRSNGVRILSDLWQFDLQNQRWNEVKRKNDPWPIPLAGHTITSYRGEKLILIGGFCPFSGFLSEPWEFQIDTEIWAPLKTKGTGPSGLFGHSTVFHAPSDNFYVFGGYELVGNGTVPSNKLYVFNFDTLHWTNLRSFYAFGESNQQSRFSLPRPRFLHAAITTDNYMLIFGGRMSPWNVTDMLYAFSYSCNVWINLLSDALHIIGPLPKQTYAQSMALDMDSGEVYVIGGWASEAKCHVMRITIPSDLCNLWSSSKFKCSQYPGCGFCAVDREGVNSIQHCYSNNQPVADVCMVQNGTLHTTMGDICEDSPLDCSQLTDCVKCAKANCKWCTGCGQCTKDKCECAEEIQQSIIDDPVKCPEEVCVASDCHQCSKQSGCRWAEIGKNSDIWQCDVTDTAVATTEEAVCKARCINYTTCGECLVESNCRWSTMLNECLDVSYQSLYCAGGACGLVLQSKDKQSCPEPCTSFKQCSTCLRHVHCGWCSHDESQGQGVCFEAKLIFGQGDCNGIQRTECLISGSSDRPLGSTCKDIYTERYPNESLELSTNFNWNYVHCPPENECQNGHHTCDSESEICVDMMEGFSCKCGPGYQRHTNAGGHRHSSTKSCVPVCSQGCVRGSCVKPNVCLCDFGYVGANCSIQCQCNGHSNCAGPDRLNECLQCHNNTMGAQCERCKPLFVGNPTTGHKCIPCIEYCNGHSSVCVHNNGSESDPPINATVSELEQYIREGPLEDARCVRCANKTTGTKCDDCIPGNFRGSENHTDACRSCDCHGHGDTCDPVTGEKCNCKNNTESDNAACQNSAIPCWTVQCSKCKDSYMGTPKDGHQCYKQMTVDSKMCFDAKLIDECKMKPKPLNPGEMVFFVIQPRFMNVDIRITVDVTQGSLNLFLSSHDDTFVVMKNTTTGVHEIDLDARYSRYSNENSEDIPFKITRSGPNDQSTNFVWMEQTARLLSTYVTIREKNTLLAVRGLKDRLVMTLPQDCHSLDTTRFYLVLQALPSLDPLVPSQASYGMVFSRQDQLHIDLFVFFSVFFSCFFLFLAACVVAWKAKQAADVRRARRRHVVEMLHMAKRPFASVTLFLEPVTPTSTRRSRLRPRSYYFHHHSAEVRPVAIEPTEDGLAAVTSVFVSMPGGHNSSGVRLALASSLILLSRQFPNGSRTFLRRRSTHTAQLPPT